MTDDLATAIVMARNWLTQQVATTDDDDLNPGDCRCCGGPQGELHQEMEPCGILTILLVACERQAQEIARLRETLEKQNRLAPCRDAPRPRFQEEP